MNTKKEPNIISAENIKSFDLWKAPDMLGQSINSEQIDARRSKKGLPAPANPVSAQSVENIHNDAYQEGLLKGKAEGLAEAKKEQQQITNMLNGLLNECQSQASHFDEKICEQLVTMTISVAKQVIRRELSIEPEQIMAVIRDAINCLPSTSEKVTLKLHPDDASIVRKIYQLNDDTERTWKIFEDPGMQRGGCIVNTETSIVNADLDSRIAAIVSQLIGGERSED